VKLYLVLIFFLFSLLTSASEERTCIEVGGKFFELESLLELAPEKYIKCSNKRKWKKAIRKSKDPCYCMPTEENEKFYFDNLVTDDQRKSDSDKMRKMMRRHYRAKIRSTLKSIIDVDALLLRGIGRNESLGDIANCSYEHLSENLKKQIKSSCGLSSDEVTNILDNEILGKDFKKNYENAYHNIPPEGACIGYKGYKALTFRNDLRNASFLLINTGAESYEDVSSMLSAVSGAKSVLRSGYHVKNSYEQVGDNIIIEAIAKNPEMLKKVRDAIKSTKSEFSDRSKSRDLFKEVSGGVSNISEVIKDIIYSDSKFIESIATELGSNCSKLYEAEVITASFCPEKSNNPELFDYLNNKLGYRGYIQSDMAKRTCELKEGKYVKKESGVKEKQALDFLRLENNSRPIGDDVVNSHYDIKPNEYMSKFLCKEIKCEQKDGQVSCSGNPENMKENLKNSFLKKYKITYNNYKDDWNACKAGDESGCTNVNDFRTFMEGYEKAMKGELTQEFVNYSEGLGFIMSQVCDKRSEDCDRDNYIGSQALSLMSLFDTPEAGVLGDKSENDSLGVQQDAMSFFAVEKTGESSSILSRYVMDSTQKDRDTLVVAVSNGDPIEPFLRNTKVSSTYNPYVSTRSIILDTQGTLASSQNPVEAENLIEISSPVVKSGFGNGIPLASPSPTLNNTFNTNQINYSVPSTSSAPEESNEYETWNGLEDSGQLDPTGSNSSVSDGRSDELERSLKRMEEVNADIERRYNDIEDSRSSLSDNDKINGLNNAISSAKNTSSRLNEEMGRSSRTSRKVPIQNYSNNRSSSSVSQVSAPGGRAVAPSSERGKYQRKLDEQKDKNKIGKKKEFVPTGSASSDKAKGSIAAKGTSSGKSAGARVPASVGSSDESENNKVQDETQEEISLDEILDANTFEKVFVHKHFKKFRLFFLSGTNSFGKEIVTVEKRGGKIITRKFSPYPTAELLEKLGIPGEPNEISIKASEINNKEVKTKGDVGLLKEIADIYELKSESQKLVEGRTKDALLENLMDTKEVIKEVKKKMDPKIIKLFVSK